MVPVTRSNKTLQDHIMVPQKKTIAVQKHTSQRNTLWWHLIHTVYLYTKQKNKYIYRFLFASFNRLVSLTVFVYIYIFLFIHIRICEMKKQKKRRPYRHLLPARPLRSTSAPRPGPRQSRRRLRGHHRPMDQTGGELIRSYRNTCSIGVICGEKYWMHGYIWVIASSDEDGFHFFR